MDKSSELAGVQQTSIQVKKEPASSLNVEPALASNAETDKQLNAIPTNSVRVKSEPMQLGTDDSHQNSVTSEKTSESNENNIATPIGITPTGELNVKHENVNPPTAVEAQNMSEVNPNDAVIAENFFNDLIDENHNTENTASPGNTNTEQIHVKQEKSQDSAQISAAVSANTTDVNINDDFFSDLIDEPPPPPPLENLPVEQLEVKFADKLRELQTLTAADVASENQPHQQNDRASKRHLADTEPNNAEKRPRVGQIRVASASSLFEKPSTPPAVAGIRVKSEAGVDGTSHNSNNATLECLPVIHYNSHQPPNNRNSSNATSRAAADLGRVKCENIFNEMEDFGDGVQMSPQIKREMALKRVAAAKELFKKHTKGLSEILHTDTVRKLPNNASYLTQQYYDNRSPLHTTNNVPFKFNSPCTDMKLQDWGLEPLTPAAARIARVIGFDAYVLNFKLQITEISKYLPGQAQQHHGMDENVTTKSSVFINATTQTMLSGPVVNKPKIKNTSTVPTQTEGTSADVHYMAGGFSARVQNFPFLKQMDKLNENQLLALNDFAELMQQQDIAADVYRLRECLLQTFHRSQLPPIVNQPTTYMQPQPAIPQVPNQMFLQPTNQLPQSSFNHNLANNHAQYESNNRNFGSPQQQLQQQSQNYAPKHNHRAQPVMQHQQQQQQQQPNVQHFNNRRNARNDPRVRQNTLFQRDRF